MLSSVKAWLLSGSVGAAILLGMMPSSAIAQTAKKDSAATEVETDESKLKGRLPAYYKENL